MRAITKKDKRKARHARVRAKVFGTPERPRLAVHKSNTQLRAQIIDDTKGHTLVYVSSAQMKAKTPKERAIEAGKKVAELAKKEGVEKVVFDRGGFKYAATIKAFADSAREAGLEF